MRISMWFRPAVGRRIDVVTGTGEDAIAAKRLLRRRLLAARAAITPAAADVAAKAIVAALLAAPTVRAAHTLAAYVPVGPEPGGSVLLDALRSAGHPLLLPVVTPDRRLDWARYDGALAESRWISGLREPAGELLGSAALGGVDLVLAPALACDLAGHRLGRGGGYYDRALAALPPTAPIVVLLHDGELLDDVPSGHHDVRVTAAVTPAGGFQPLAGYS